MEYIKQQSIFQKMKSFAVFTDKYTLTAALFLFLEQGTVLVDAIGPGLVTTITLEYFTGLSFKLHSVVVLQLKITN